MSIPSSLLAPLVLLVVVVPSSAGDLAPLFTSPVFETGIGPNQMVVADFDGDGLPDVATANYGVGSVSVLLGNGLGGFAAKQDVLVGTFGIAIATGDLEFDGDLDLVVGKDVASTVAVLLNDGTGNFSVVQQALVGASPRAVALGDFNGDRWLDLVAASFATNSVALLAGDGSGTFAPVGTVTVGPQPGSVTLVDLDLDGWLDLLTANEGASSVSLRFGTGSGEFGPLTSLAVGPQPSGLVADDLDGDGYAEIATVNAGAGTASVIGNNGDGSFDPPLHLAAGYGGSAIATADVDGNGWHDLLVANDANVVLSSTVSVLLGQGGLVFDPPKSALVGPLASDVKASDLDGDGDQDLLAASAQSGVSVLLGDGTGTFLATVNYAAGGGSARSMASGLFDADSRSDVAIVGTFGVSILLDNAGSGLAPPVILPGTSGTYSVAAADVDGDGRTDLVAGQGAAPGMKVFLGDGAGGFALAHSLGWPGVCWDLLLADLDRDGRLDLVSADTGVTVAFGLGDGAFGAPVSYGPAAVSRVAVGRLDEDAWLDVVGSAGTLGLAVLRNDGSGGLLAPEFHAPIGSAIDVALGDLNHDGALDAVAGHLSGTTCTLWAGDGSGGFAPAEAVGIDFSPRSVWIADLDADGDDDLAAAGYHAWTLSLRRSDGVGGLLPLETYTIATEAVNLVDGDVDGDHALDLLVGNAESGTITVLLNQGPPDAWTDLGHGLAGSFGIPQLEGAGVPQPSSLVTLALQGGPPTMPVWLILGGDVLDAPFKGGTLVPVPDVALAGLGLDDEGDLQLVASWPPGIPAGTHVFLQAWLTDRAGIAGYAATNGLQLVVP